MRKRVSSGERHTMSSSGDNNARKIGLWRMRRVHVQRVGRLAKNCDGFPRDIIWIGGLV